MAALSNGFPISPSGGELGVSSYLVPGTTVRLSVRADIAPLLIGFATEFNRLIEPLHAGQCGGYNYRKIKGSDNWSFHAGAVAIDLNSLKHPWGAEGTFRSELVPVIRALAAKYGLRWGGDYHGKKDEMHFEVILPFGVAQALAKTTPGMGAFPIPASIPTDVAVLELTLTGTASGQSEEFADAIVGSNVVGTIEGASSLEVTVLDPTRRLLRGVAGSRARLTVGPQVYELAGVAKSGDEVAMTFEDQLATTLRRRTGFLTVAAGTMSRTDFVRKLVHEERQIRFVGQHTELTSPTTRGIVISPEALSRGTQEEPDSENSWEAAGRLADEIGWRRFSDGQAIYFASDAWLASRAAPIELSESTPGVDGIDFNYDVGLPVAEATITVNLTRTALPPGFGVNLSGLGPADGLWLIKDKSRPLDNAQGTVTLQRVLVEKFEVESSGLNFNNWPGSTVEGDTVDMLTGGAGGGRGAAAQYASGSLSGAQVAKVLYDAGFRGNDLLIAIAVAGAEAGWSYTKASKPNKNGSVDYGLMQINSIHKFDPHLLVTDPAYNARCAFTIYVRAGRSFTPWVAFKNGRYRSWLLVAGTAVALGAATEAAKAVT